MEDTLTSPDGGSQPPSSGAVALAEDDNPIHMLGDRLVKLSFVETHYLRRYLRDTYGIEAPPEPDAVVEPSSSDKKKEPEKVEEPTIFDLVITGFDQTKKLHAVKEVRAINGMSIGDAKALVEASSPATPKVIKEAMSKADAEKAKAALEAIGATVQLK